MGWQGRTHGKREGWEEATARFFSSRSPKTLVADLARTGDLVGSFSALAVENLLKKRLVKDLGVHLDKTAGVDRPGKWEIVRAVDDWLRDNRLGARLAKVFEGRGREMDLSDLAEGMAWESVEESAQPRTKVMDAKERLAKARFGRKVERVPIKKSDPLIDHVRTLVKPKISRELADQLINVWLTAKDKKGRPVTLSAKLFRDAVLGAGVRKPAAWTDAIYNGLGDFVRSVRVEPTADVAESRAGMRVATPPAKPGKPQGIRVPSAAVRTGSADSAALVKEWRNRAVRYLRGDGNDELSANGYGFGFNKAATQLAALRKLSRGKTLAWALPRMEALAAEWRGLARRSEGSSPSSHKPYEAMALLQASEELGRALRKAERAESEEFLGHALEEARWNLVEGRKKKKKSRPVRRNAAAVVAGERQRSAGGKHHNRAMDVRKGSSRRGKHAGADDGGW